MAAKYTYGICNKRHARRDKKGVVEFILWPEGHERSPHSDFWARFDSSWWPDFKPYEYVKMVKRPPLNTLIAYLYVCMVKHVSYDSENMTHNGLLNNVSAGKEAFDQITLKNLLWKWVYQVRLRIWEVTS